MKMNNLRQITFSSALLSLTMTLCLWLALSGCGQETRLAPEVGLSSIRITEVKFLRGNCLILLQVSNPNPDPLTLEGLRVAISSQGQNFATGMVAANRMIPGYTREEIEIPGSISNLSLLQVTGKLLELKSEIRYGMDVTMTIRDENGARATRTAQKSGSIPLKLPDMSNDERVKAFQADPKRVIESLMGKKDEKK